MSRFEGFLDEGEFLTRMAEMTQEPKKKMKRRIKVLSEAHVRDALAAHLRALSILDDDEAVVKFKRVPEGLEVDIEKDTD